VAVTGTISQNQMTLQRVFDRAFARAGIPMQTVTAEYLETAKDLLNLSLSEFVTTGVTLWTSGVIRMGMQPGLSRMTLPDGTIEVDRIVLMQTDTTSTTVSGTSPTWLVGASSAVAGEFVGVKVSAAGTYNVAVDVSYDGTNYTQAASFSNLQMFTGQWNWLELDIAATATTFYRVRETTPASFPVVDAIVAVGRSESEVPPLGQDQYSNLPNKKKKGTVTSHYEERLVDGPVIYLWNAPDDAHGNYILSVWRKRHMIDVSSMTSRIEVPQRWMDAIIWDLAWRLCAEIPEAKASMGELRALAKETRAGIAPSETDNGVVSLGANISMYTA
jgi:hypothetical protein